MADRIGDMTVGDFLRQLVGGDRNSAPNVSSGGSNAVKNATDAGDGLGKVATNAPLASQGLWAVWDASTKFSFGIAGASQRIGDEAAGFGKKFSEYNGPMSSFVQGIADASSASGQLGQVWKQSSLGLGSESVSYTHLTLPTNREV